MAPTPVSQDAPARRFNETTVAILAAFVASLVLGTVMAGNPIHAMRVAYTDYSKEPVPPGREKPLDLQTVLPDANQPAAKP